MKLIVLLFLFVICSIGAAAQLPTGIYESSPTSYRSHYYLHIQEDSLTFFGWELTMNKDTTYFKSRYATSFIKVDSINSLSLTFTNFSCSSYPLRPYSRRESSTDTTCSTAIFWLHRYLFNFQLQGKTILLDAAKDSYDSSADRFEFIRISE